MWSVTASEFTWRQGAVAVLVWVLAVQSVVFWCGLHAGQLQWSGSAWFWANPEHIEPTPGNIRLHADFQGAMLILVSPALGRSFWILLFARTEPTQWSALRRAVVQS
jgi:hypothetical protein